MVFFNNTCISYETSWCAPSPIPVLYPTQASGRIMQTVLSDLLRYFCFMSSLAVFTHGELFKSMIPWRDEWWGSFFCHLADIFLPIKFSFFTQRTNSTGLSGHRLYEIDTTYGKRDIWQCLHFIYWTNVHRPENTEYLLTFGEITVHRVTRKKCSLKGSIYALTFPVDIATDSQKESGWFRTQLSDCRGVTPGFAF